MSKISDWWCKVRWNWRRKDIHAPIHKWEVEKYLRNNNISHLEFYNEVADKIRKQRQVDNESQEVQTNKRQMKKEHEIIMLPSEKPSNIKLGVKVKSITHPPMRYVTDEDFDSDEWNKFGTFQHLYILSDEEIKEGDWYYNELDKAVRKNNTINHSYHKKIIATTDPKLHTNEIVEEDMHMYKKSLPQIPQSFIEEYCKAGGIDEVLVEYEQHCSAISDYIQRRPIDRNVYLKPALKDNIIIIHPVEEKMYSRDEVINAFKYAFKEAKEAVIWSSDYPIYVANKWIEENL